MTSTPSTRTYRIHDASGEAVGQAPGTSEHDALVNFNRDACSGEGTLTRRASAWVLQYAGDPYTASLHDEPSSTAPSTLASVFTSEAQARQYVQDNAHRPGRPDGPAVTWGPPLEQPELARLEAAYAYISASNDDRRLRIPDLELVERLYHETYAGDCNPAGENASMLSAMWLHARGGLEQDGTPTPEGIARRVVETLGTLYFGAADEYISAHPGLAGALAALETAKRELVAAYNQRKVAGTSTGDLWEAVRHVGGEAALAELDACTDGHRYDLEDFGALGHVRAIA